MRPTIDSSHSLSKSLADTFMTDMKMILAKIHAELSRIVDEPLLVAMKPLLVTPRCEKREWDYGTLGQNFECWIVLEHLPTNTCVAYCDLGFGPSSPWGLLFIAGDHISMGMDSGWYSNFEVLFANRWHGTVRILQSLRSLSQMTHQSARQGINRMALLDVY